VNGFEAYKLYNAIRLHFNTDFNAVKYHFKTRVNPSSFEMKKERYFFEKIARTYPNLNDLIGFYTSNFLKENTWPTEMKDSVYKEWQGRLDSFSYLFSEDCKVILDQAEDKSWDFTDLFKTRSTFLYDLYHSDIIKIETLCLFEMMLKKRWMQLHSSQDPLGLYETLSSQVYKYRLLLEFLGIQPTTKMAENAIKVLTPILSCDNI
tara:strand:+ start:3901 stop:4518 length:618 start_codon:yes stop_codon:yes gene_type:complete